MKILRFITGLFVMIAVVVLVALLGLTANSMWASAHTDVDHLIAFAVSTLIGLLMLVTIGVGLLLWAMLKRF